jgi:thermitase
MHILVPSRLLLSSVLALGMAGCSGLPNKPQSDQAAKYSLSIKIDASDSPSAIAQQYAGTVIAWHPEDGFAILGLNQIPNRDQRWIGLDDNQDGLNNPEVQSDGSPVAVPVALQNGGSYWNSSKTVWGDSSSVWAGGIKIWVTGDGTLPTQQQNATVWDAVHLLDAWKGSPQLGAGIKVAVIDTGLDTTHPAFQGRLAPQNEWHDFVSNDALPQEDGLPTDAAFGHGTGVAGLIVQVAPKAQIMPLRVLDSNGQGNELNLVAAIGWAIAHNAKLINLSLGSEKSSSAVNNMIKAASRLGIVVVASAGNDAVHKSNFPASNSKNYSNVLSVASSSVSINSTAANPAGLPYSFAWAWYSNFGPDISVVAPGENLFTPFPGNAGKSWNGTSFSTALISGSMALRMSQRPFTTSAAAMMQTSVVNGLTGAPDPAAKSKVLCSCGEIDVGKLQTQ